MKATRILLSLIAVVIAHLSAHATTVTIKGAIHYGMPDPRRDSSYEIQFDYDPAYPLTLIPAGTNVEGHPLYKDFFSVPGAGITDLIMRIGNSGWLVATTGGFWIDGDIGTGGTSVHYLWGGFSSAAGRVSIGTPYNGGGKTRFWDDVFVTGGGFAPGEYSITVVPDGTSTAVLTVMGLLMFGLVEIHRKKMKDGSRS